MLLTLMGYCHLAKLEGDDSPQSYQEMDPSFETLRLFVSWHIFKESEALQFCQVSTPP